MPHPLRIYPFGGVGEFGKNMMVYALGEDAVIVDCGMGFPEPGQHGVDVVVPDVSALRDLGLKLHALLLTHGHEDHIGGIPYLLPQLNVPVYGTPMTLGLVGGKLAEDRKLKGDLRPLPDDGERIRVGPFEVEAIPVTHSIMDAVSIAIHTPHGVIVHTGDFKLDLAPIDGRATQMHRFSALGDAGVVLLASDSTNATRSGSGPAERSVGPALKQAVMQCEGKVVVTTFASNMFRIQQIIDAAVAAGRRVALAGRSLDRNTDIAQRLERLSIPAGTMVNIKQISDVPPEKLLIIATGSQGEAQAALARIAQGRHPSIKLEVGDLVIFSSSNIPGNERTIAGLFNHIYRRGARVLHAGQAHLHVSGHAQAHELKTMLHLTRPKYFYPVHGEYRYLVEHKLLGRAVGIDEKNIVIAENGQSVVVDAQGIRLGEPFAAGAVFVDGMNRDEIDDLVLRDRRVLAEDGIMTVMVVVNQHSGTLLGTPEMVAKGVLHQESEDKLNEAAEGLLAHLEQSGQEFLSDVDAAKEEIRIWTRRWCKKNLGRHPMVVPVVIEV
jgi:ribonuclease J